MKCNQCNIEYEPKRKTSIFCSPKCKQASYRNNLSVTHVTVTPVYEGSRNASEITDPTILDNIDPTKAIVHALSAQDLYSAILHYPYDTWKDGPEYAELMRRLKSKSIEELTEEGYSIPNWKRKEVA